MSLQKSFKIILAIAIFTTLGSLYFSTFGDPLADIAANTLFQGPGLEPCHLCRWGRIFMYPIVAISALGILRKNKEHMMTIGVLSGLGIAVAIYHYLIQTFNINTDTICSRTIPCNVVQWELFGFITLPLMEIVIFGIFIGMSLAQIKKNRM